MVAFLETHGPIPETRPEATTEALVARFPRLGAVQVTDVVIDGPHGAVPARSYASAGAGDVALLWLHGGAWVGGSLDMPEAHFVSLLLAAAGVPVLSADYTKVLHGVTWPAPSDDALAAWRFAAANLGASRLAIGGASAGANLAAGVAKRLRDGGGESPVALVLVYPLLHAALPEFSAPLAAAIDRAPADAFIFTPELTAQITRHFAGDESVLDDPYAFPANGTLAGLPPTLVVNCEFDTLRASGEAFAAALHAAGVAVDVECVPGVAHGFLDQPQLASAEAAVVRIAGWLATSH